MNFTRGTLLEAFNVNMNYDIISLFETSLNETIVVEENLIPGYKFYPWNHPDGSRNGGVGMFYKESLPLRGRLDISFEECLVSELMFGHKKSFLLYFIETQLTSPEFDHFIKDFESLCTNFKNEKPYAMFFAGDFNGHMQAWVRVTLMPKEIVWMIYSLR